MRALLLALALLGTMCGLAAPAHAQEGPFGTLVRSDGVGDPYALTAEDALWSARMLVGEAGGEDDADGAAVLWCMLNSYMLRPLRKDYPTFTDFVRAYCTPLQKFLKSKGALERHRKLGTKMVEVEEGKWQLERHVELQKRPWEKLAPGARAVVERVFRGKAATPCGNATQFCSTATYFHDKHGRKPSDEELAAYTEEYAKEKAYTWFKVEKSRPRSNCFFVEKRFASLPAGVVKVDAKK
ncbi:MAG: hypothetical protein ACAI25_17575 [Planctomycetota bacterium]